jgi:hypothetical protein
MTIYVKEAKAEQPIQTLEETLVQFNGVDRALLDIEDGEIKIEYNENQVSQEKIREMILEHGWHLL